jgi:hypothetical protein
MRYNGYFPRKTSMRRPCLFITVLSLAALAGCARRNSKTAVERAIQKHLHENTNVMLNTFITQFESVSAKGDTANAIVKYQSKALPRLAVHVRYTLKLDHGEWQVISSSTDAFDRSNPANPHAGTALDQMPPPQSMPAPVASH